MRKIQFFFFFFACTLMTSCGNMNQVLSAIQNGSVINAITSVIGLDKVSAQNLIGSWTYNGPGCAFTSENLLAKAGRDLLIEDCWHKLQWYLHLRRSIAANQVKRPVAIYQLLHQTGNQWHLHSV